MAIFSECLGSVRPLCMIGHMLSSSFVLVYISLSLMKGCSCQNSSLVFSQQEEGRIGHFVGSVAEYVNTLSTVGEGDRSSLRYSMLPDSSGYSSLFTIDSVSGNLSLAKRVDRESICPLSNSCEVRFRVAVSGRDNFFITVPATVNILDVNDNSPTFPPPGEVDIHISEAASFNFTHVIASATDADTSEKFGVLSYTLEPPSDTFLVVMTRNFVGTSHVNLLVKQKLDREVQERYKLLVVAKDGGDPPRSGSLTVNVVVDDVNDNDPTFSNKVYSASFGEEKEQGYKIITVEATDNDVGDNGKIVYELNSVLSGNSEITDKIHVDRATGELSLQQRITSGEYRFVIDARDLGNPPRSDQAVVKVTVLDTINNQPIVRLNPVQIGALPIGWVSEGSRESTVVAVISVEDNDTGKNGSVSCQSLDSFFQLQLLETKRYKLMLAKTLDRETNNSLTVEIVCKDEGNPSLNSTTSFIVNVFDINDNSPVFLESSYTQAIPENNLIDSTVLVVSASDMDDGQNGAVEYMLRGDEGNFRIISESGVIKASRRFDREQVAKYTFQVLAVDRGSPSLTGTASVTVVISDVNDVAPGFSQDSYKFQIYENNNPGSIVGNITVFDPDLESGGVVVLTLKSMTDIDNVPFVVTSDGVLSSRGKLDREETDTYHFYVIATDQGRQKLSSSATITVQILDVNDNRPTFVFPSDQNFTSYISTPVDQDSAILRVDVNDSDGNQNAFITYTLAASNASRLFRIGLFDGQVFANTDLGTSEAGIYFLDINVTDQGVPQLWDVRTLYIVIQSKYSNTDDDKWHLHVLIIACIVCGTIIVSGVILMVICMVRKQDKMASLQTTESLFPRKQLTDNKYSIDDGQHRRQVVVKKPEDFHSTSSNETATTGDSGLGSDEDMSTSLEQAAPPSVFTELATPIDRPVLWSRVNPNTGRSASSSPQHYLVQQTAMKSNSIVRFHSHVTDKQPAWLPERTYFKQPQNSTFSTSRGQQSKHPTASAPSQGHQNHYHQSLQNIPQRPPQTTPHTQFEFGPKSSIPLQGHGQKQISFLSQSSFGDDNSDLNTTTSGSYSVASDDAERFYSLADARVKDMYV
ncbi:unnamed protein product [Candidula unifasciata]|uniref:Cadherin domain-containing protein n=1 Tax=Candidula unifasciata TaxID=100452 RepID=A0A8S4A3L9_9EUPU|nr:unnamed protein product [Candidula unifasciata]